MNCAQRLEQRLHEVVRADRNAARRDQGVGLAKRAGDELAQAVGAVRRDPQQSDLRACLAKRGQQGPSIRVGDLSWAGRLAHLDQLVSRRHERDPGPPVHPQPRHSERGREPDLGGTELRAGRHHQLAGAQVGARPVKVCPGLQASRHRHRVAVHTRVLDHHDGVRAVRHDASGQDAGRGPDVNVRGEGAARSGLTDDPQRAAGVGCPDRIAVHRAGGMRRQSARSHQVLREHAAVPIGERNRLGAEHGRVLQHERGRFGRVD